MGYLAPATSDNTTARSGAASPCLAGAAPTAAPETPTSEDLTADGGGDERRSAHDEGDDHHRQLAMKRLEGEENPDCHREHRPARRPEAAEVRKRTRQLPDQPASLVALRGGGD